jgi:predicted naringenin-chalcone synthase
MKNENKKNVYIGELKTILPELYDPNLVAEVVYPVDKASELVNRLAKRAIKSIGIKQRPFVRSREKFPERVLDKEEYHPLNWGKTLISHLLNFVKPEEVGFLNVSYNITSHIDFLPNLACQLALQMNLNLDVPPEELVYYGCAAALFSLKSAVDYCATHDKAAIIYNFDQCSWICSPEFDQKHPEFNSSLKTNLIFGDGGAGILVIPESMKDRFESPLIKILDIETGFSHGAEMKMNNGRFLLGDNVQSVMPGLVSNKIVKPMLKKNNIAIDQIKEWSIHQGGKPILEAFKEPAVLGLNDDQIHRSKELFEAYGNFSSPSCLFILDSYMKEDNKLKNDETLGVVVGYGAGYYLGAMIYCWE